MPPMIGNQVLYSGVLISLTLHGLHAFTTAGVRLKQKFLFSNICPGRGLNPGPRSLMAVNVTTRLRRNPKVTKLLLRSAPDPCTAKKKSFEARVKCYGKNPGEQSLRQRKPIPQRGQPLRM